jgi:hypothetical protein
VRTLTPKPNPRLGQCAGMSLDELAHSAGGPFLLKVSLNVLGIS